MTNLGSNVSYRSVAAKSESRLIPENEESVKVRVGRDVLRTPRVIEFSSEWPTWR